MIWRLTKSMKSEESVASSAGRRRPLSTIRALLVGAAMTAVAGGALLANPVTANADAVAYLVNVTVRPGYQFAGAAAALDYGYGLCDDVTAGHPYAALIAKIKLDMQTSDEYQAGYLINQAVNELCPAQIWQLRRSAAGYQPTVGNS